jgi:hypothetical protein
MILSNLLFREQRKCAIKLVQEGRLDNLTPVTVFIDAVLARLPAV